MSHLEILDHVAGDSRRAADDPGDAQHAENAGVAGDTDEHHQDRRDEEGAERETADGVVRTPEETDEIAGHRGEEKPEKDHHDRQEQRPGQASAKKPVQTEHGNREGGDRGACLPEVEVDIQPLHLTSAALGRLQIGDRPTDALHQRGAQLEQGVERRHHHRADRQRSDLPPPDLGAQVDERRLVRRLAGELRVEEEAQRHEHQPPQHRAREQRAGDLRADDEANADQSGRGGRRL